MSTDVWSTTIKRYFNAKTVQRKLEEGLTELTQLTHNCLSQNPILFCNKAKIRLSTVYFGVVKKL